mmetsp:Transcript_96723/g.211518  ORF Transcript_96723/g.211518 Transcript_96723/m.211518 type:complete len:88 (+) Transcript_96723:207-470(+)
MPETARPGMADDRGRLAHPPCWPTFQSDFFKLAREALLCQKKKDPSASRREEKKATLLVVVRVFGHFSDSTKNSLASHVPWASSGAY